jgi:two-component system sensor histidine kinase YesM
MLILIGAFGFFFYSTDVFKANTASNLERTAEMISKQLDNQVQPMEYVSLDFFSREEFLTSVASLSNLDRSDVNNKDYISESRFTIRKALIKDSINRNFYRISVYNKKGDFFTSNYRIKSRSSDISGVVSRLEWLDEARQLSGKCLLVPPYKDVWAENDPQEVISLIRVIQGPMGECGFLEIQKLASSFYNVCHVDKETGINVLVLDEKKNVIYSSRDLTEDSVAYYYELCRNMQGRNSNDQGSDKAELLKSAYSSFTGYTVILTQSYAVLTDSLAMTRNLIITIGISLIVISLLFIYLFSMQITKPLHQLKVLMEEVSIKNLPSEMTIEGSNNEIESLNNSFQRMRKRLMLAFDLEMRLRSMHIKACFDSLQARINPHFLYNILNVVSAKGLASGDEEICEICGQIADMLRYSTSTKQRTVTIRDEIKHVSDYLNLMMKRYEEKLSVQIDIDDRIMDAKIVKLVLQPLVENSIRHGFSDSSVIMKIQILGYLDGDGWCVDIIDNGKGIDDITLAELKTKMARFEDELFDGNGDYKIEIAGMGIVSTYGRMYLFYNGKFKFQIENIPQGGLRVSLGGVLENDF